MKSLQIKALLFGASILAGGIVFAQNDESPSQPRPPRHHRPPPPVIPLAIDANHDRVVDANEIANASAALLTLDENGDGQLTLEELCPPCPNPGRFKPIFPAKSL
jgi:hypothetical protein